MAVEQSTVSDPEDWDTLAQRWVTNAAKLSAMQSNLDPDDFYGVSVGREALIIGIVASGDGWAKSFLEVQGLAPDNDLMEKLFSAAGVTLPGAKDLDELFTSAEFSEVQQKLLVTDDVDVPKLRTVTLEEDVQDTLVRASALNGGGLTGWTTILQLLLTEPEIYTFAEAWWQRPVEVTWGQNQRVVIGRHIRIPETRPLAILILGHEAQTPKLIERLIPDVPELADWKGEPVEAPFAIENLGDNVRVLQLRYGTDALQAILNNPSLSQRIDEVIEEIDGWFCPVLDDYNPDFITENPEQAKTALELLRNARHVTLSVGDEEEDLVRFQDFLKSWTTDAGLRPDPFLAAVSVLSQRSDVDQANPADSDRASGTDYLNTEPAAQAIAWTIAHKETMTPLSIGILGSWGSGKSFIMRQIVTALDNIDSTAPEDLRDQLVKDIRIVEFNAWTYAKGDLWSAILFEILKQLKGGPVLGRLKSLTKARLKLEEKQRDLAQATVSSETSRWETELRLEKIQKTYDDFSEQLEKARQQEDRNAQSANIARQALSAELESTQLEIGRLRAQRFTETIRAILPFLRGKSDRKSWLLFVVSVTAFILAFVFLAIPPDFIKIISERVVGAISAFTGAVSVLLSGLDKMLKHVDDTKSTVQNYRDRIAGIQSKLAGIASASDTTDETDLKAIEDGRGKALREMQQARSQLQTINTQVKQAEIEVLRAENIVQEREREFRLHSAKRDLQEFINTRLAEGDYRRRLSHLQRVQEDLAELSSIINKEGWTDKAPERIVLLIDDLDRCPPDQVVEVLEAVQLLLAENPYIEEKGRGIQEESDSSEDEPSQNDDSKKPLQPFVVVLGADTRIITRALEKQYKGILDLDNPPGGLDYLEKIIQIPYRVRAMDKDDYSIYISRLTNVELPVRAVGTTNQLGTIGTNGQAVGDQVLSDSAEPVKWRLPTNLKLFDETDIEHFVRYASLAADYPRAIKRLVNQYRLCKVMGFGSGSFSGRETAFLLTMAGGFRLSTRLLVSRIQYGNIQTGDSVVSTLEGQLTPIAQGTNGNIQRISEIEVQEIETLIPILKRLEERNEVPSPEELRPVLRSVVPFCFLGDIDSK